jgi:hypothetical protein
MRKKRSNTMPTTVKLRHPPPASSPRVIPITEDLMSLEDFLAETDRTPNRRRVMELKRASLIINSPPVTPRDSLLLSAPHSAGHTHLTPSGGGEKMFDLQEFLMRGFEPGGNVRQSITEVDEAGGGGAEEALQLQPATEFQSQGSGLSSSQLSQGLSQLSQHSEGKSSAAELNVSANSNTNNNNSNDDGDGVWVYDSLGGGAAVMGGGRVRSESFMSLEEMMSEFEGSLGSSAPPPAGLPVPGSELRPHPQVLSDESATPTPTTMMSPFYPPSSVASSTSNQHLASGEEESSPSRNLSAQHQRQHSCSFNSGLNRLTVPAEPPLHHRSQTLSFSKSVSTDMLSGKGAAAKTAKTRGRGRDKTKKGVAATAAGSKKKRHTGSTEVLSGRAHRDASSLKPPPGRPRKNKLVLQPRGPLYGEGGGSVELREHSALMVESSSSHLSQLTHVDYTTEPPPSRVSRGGETGEEEEEGGGVKMKMSRKASRD